MSFLTMLRNFTLNRVSFVLKLLKRQFSGNLYANARIFWHNFKFWGYSGFLQIMLPIKYITFFDTPNLVIIKNEAK